MSSYIAKHIPDSLSFLEVLVNQNSFTPNKNGSDAIIDLLISKLSPIGFNFERIKNTLVGDTLIATNYIESNISNKPILISAHVDTVHPDNSNFKYFKLENDKAWGPGIFDMKGSIAMLLLSLEELNSKGLLKKIPLKLVFNSDEETGSTYSAGIIFEASHGCSHALVLEPARPNNGILTRRKGRIKGSYTCTGIPAHAGNDISKGANAIVQMSHTVSLINELNDVANLISANVGLISGGVATNVVPDLCNAVFEIRFSKTEDANIIRQKISNISEQIIISGTQLQHKEEDFVPCLDQTPESLRLALAYIEKAKTINQNITLFDEVAGGTSDANFIAPSGVPVIDGLGLIGAGAHTKQEYIEVDSLATRALALAAWLRDSNF